ncbi:hypothetical protein FC14_GL000630 [Ligilactobacillus agilis DSM 20509]|uniref:Phage protein n=1 Tax=Ligilactobacillus agilis DSM 20509 TaxID=1423718 RepID=A0A0R2AJ61_9LACO|nr:hypothetical protein [Ligilactobacillus agilis]KRM63347.1 hypothetical protein FC14_GL000630 [Ligilactobacillus agilis DSM 20509]
MARTRIKLISGYEADIEDLVNDFIEDPKNKVKKVNAVDFYLFGVYDDITACINYELDK